MNDQGLTFDSEWFSKIAEFEKEFSSSNPGVNPRDPKFSDKRKNWAEAARREVRRSVYQDTLRDLLESGIPGVSEMKDANPSVDDDFSGTLAVDPDSDLHEFATLRQNQYESGNPMIYWDDYQKNKPTKAKAALNDFFINAVLAFEGAAESVGKYVGGVAGDMLYPQYSFAEQLGVSRNRLEHIVKTMEGGPSLAIGYDRSKELTDEDKAIYARYLEMRQPLIEGIRSGEGQAYRGFARSLTNKLMTDDVEFYRDVVVGSDPNKPKDIREGIGRAGGGALVNASGMTGSAIGIIPYSIPAMATRNTKVALALTSPFYAMGHTDAWDRRMRIYEEQAAEAAALGLPAPARPGFGTLNRQAQIAGGTELASEFTLDRLQLALPHVGRWASRRFPRMLKPANRVADSGSELLESFSRKRGLLGAAKGAGLVAAGGVIEGVEELIPPLGQELFIDPFFIPEGYENDFFSPHTAEALGTGFIAGTIMQGGRAGIDPITPSGIARRRARRRVRRAAEGSTAMVAGAIVDKAGRIARARFSANAVAARGSTMAMHQVEQMGSGDRIAMFVSPENVDATLTPAVRERMAAVQITDKPIGRVDGFDVYAPVAFVNEVQEYIGSGEVGKITGNAELMEPDLPMLGAIVIRNKAGQIVDVVPYTDSKAADDALPMISHKAMISGTTAEKVEGDSLSAISESIELQVDGDATMAGLTPPSKRPISTERKQRGIAALRLEALDEAKPGQNPDDPFQSSMLTQDEIGGAKNSDVEVDVEFREVDPETLSDEERRIGKAIGVNPVVLDGKVVFRIKRPDGTTDVIEKDTIGRGSYLSQVGPDGIFLIRDRNGVMNARTAFVVAMHELRHRFVGKSKTAAEYLSRLLYLDPEFALRGGAQYMQDYVRAFPNNRDVQQDRAILDMDEATVIAYYAGLHGAALSVLADDAGYRDAVRAMRDPNATEEQRSVAQARIAEQQQAEADLGRVERFAEESLANVAENALGITAQKAIEWETFYKDAAGMSHKKFVAWLSHVLAKNGFAGPEARQAVYEVSQRMSGMQDEQMRVHRKLREEVETKAREDMRKYLEMKAGMVPSEKPASEPAAAASEPPVPTPAQQPSQMSLRSQVAAPGKGVAAGDYDKEPDELRAAREQLDAIKDLPSEQRAGALAKVIGSLAEVVPLLTNLQANVGGTSRAGQQQMRFPQGVPERTPETVSPEPMSAGETMSPEMISPGARAMVESQRRSGGPMAALRKKPRAMAKPEFFSALSREVEGIDANAMSGSAWAQRVKGLVAQGKVKQAEVDWTGLEDWLALPRTEKVTKQEIVDFMGRSGIQVVTNRVGENLYGELDRGIEDGVFNAREAVDQLGGLTADIESAIDQYGTLAQEALANGKPNLPFGSEVPAKLRPALDQVEEITGMSVLDWINDAQENANYEEQKYESYTLQGGSNYRETLLRLPPGSKGAPKSDYMDPHFDASNVVAHIRTTDRSSASQKEIDETNAYFVEKDEDGWVLTYKSPDGGGWSLGDDDANSFPSREAAENALQKMKSRLNRKLETGRVLFVEELQSDWAQMGRKNGFGIPMEVTSFVVSETPNLVIRQSNLFDDAYFISKKDESGDVAIGDTRPVHGKHYGFIYSAAKRIELGPFDSSEQARDAILNQRLYTHEVTDGPVGGPGAFYTSLQEAQKGSLAKAVPSAPFVETTDGWLNLALKRVIMDAVEGGYDRVAFVNGEQSADRYDLSKRIRSIMHRRTPDGGYDISAIANEGSVVLEQKNASPSELEGIVGKEVTKKIVAGDGRVDEEFETSVFPIRTVMYRRNADGTFDFDAIDVEGVGRISKTRAPLSDVERLLSKRMAELMASGAVATSPEYGRPPRYSDDFKQISEELPSITLGEKREPFKALEGVDLKVGGEGMKAFYDKIVPAAATKLLKKLGGGKVVTVDANTGDDQLGFEITPELRQRVMDAGGTPMFSLRRSVRENWKAKSKAIDQDGELTTVYNGSPIGFMEFDSQRMGRTDRPVSIGAATSSTTADGMWFTDSRTVASESAGTASVNMLPKVARILNAKTKALANRLPRKALRRFENAAGIPLQDYVVSTDGLSDFMGNDGLRYEDVVRGHIDYLSEMVGNDPASVALIDQAFQSDDITMSAAELSGSRGGVLRSANLKLENPLVVPFQTGEPRQTDAGLERDDEPFITQASKAIAKMRSMGNDGLIMEMPDGEKRYFIRNPSQFDVVGFARDAKETSLLSLRKTASLKNMIDVAKSRKWQKGRDLKASMQDSVLAEAEKEGIDLKSVNEGVIDEKSMQYLVDVGVEDAKAALRDQSNAIGWYDIKTRIALAVVSLIHPEIKTDPNSKFAFVFALAVTSNGTKVAENFVNANKAYTAWKRTGKMPTDIGVGTPAEAINSSMALFNKLSENWGMEDFRKFMLTDFRVDEISRLSKDLSPNGELADTIVRGAAVLGPKIGNGFFSNLYGMFDALTMDRWLIRTWGRWTGSLLKTDPVPIQAALTRVETAVASLTDKQAAKLAEIIKVKDIKALDPKDIADRVKKKSSDAKSRAKLQSSAGLDELRRASNRYMALADGQKEIADNGSERRRIREVFSRILEEIRKDPKYKNLTMADLQAVLWYAEKRLYETAKVDPGDGKSKGYEDKEAPDYANAAIALARDAGVSDDEIRRQEDIENGRTGTARRADGRTGDDQIERLKSLDTPGFAPKERRAFAGGRIAARAKEERRGVADGKWSYSPAKPIGVRSSRRARDVTSSNRTESVTTSATMKPGYMLKYAYETFGHSVPEYLELDQSMSNASAFRRFLEDAKASQRQFGASVFVYPAEEYANMRMFIADDGMSGFAIKPDGDIVSVFSTTGNVDPATGQTRSGGRSAIEAAIIAGGKKLDCFDTMLPKFYAAHGFVESARLAWDDSQAPENWDYKAFSKYSNGRPDVVMMVYDPDAGDVGTRVKAKTVDKYGEAIELQDKMMRDVDNRVKGAPERPAMMSMRRGLPGVKDEAVLRYIDKYDELRRLVDVASERGTNLPAVLNPYIGARVLSGVLGAALGRYERSYARLLRRMHVAGVSLDEMDEFLTAQHARERNEYVATINRAFPDGGSGMMSADADNIIQRARNSGRFATLNGFAEEWRRMLRSSLDQRLANGLITQQTYDNLTSRYKNYVPLRGAPAQINDEDFLDFGEAGGRGLSTTGRGVPAALGRRSVAQGVTSQVGFVTEDTFRRIERNRIGQSFLALVLALGDRNTAEVVRPTRRAVVNGTVRTMHDPTWMTDQRNFGLYVNRPVTVGGHTYEPGDLVVIRINNRRLADAMTQPSLELRSFEHALRHVNNGWRFLTTGMGNPTFAPVNLLRDVLTGTLNNLASRGAIDTMSMLARWPGAFRNVFMDAWRGGEPTGSYRRFIRAGGDQLYWRPNDLELKAVQFDELERRVSRRDPDDRTLARTLFGWYPAFFTAAETATRVAQYDQRIATGSAPSEAALAARDITVDFAKGGLAKPVLNTWYMFLNAGLQGNVNVLRSLARSAALVPSLIAMGFVNAAMARFMGGDDEETNQSNWDNVPAYEKTSNMFFFEPSGSGRHIKVPLPYGYNVFFSLGARMADAVYGRSTASDVLSGALVDALNAFNPMGGSGITSGGVALAAAAVPTMARPAIELLGNEDFTGRPIFREQFGRFPGPDSAAAFDGTPEGYLALSEFMNRATGGDEYESGMVDVSPNTIQYLLGYYLSGAGRNLDRLYKAALSNEEVTANDLPLVRSFVGDASNDTRTLSQEFYGTMEALAPTARRIDVAEDEDAPMERRMAAGAGLETAQVAMLGELEPYDKALTEIRKQLRGATPEQREAILEVRRRILKSAIRRRNELTDMGYRVK